jgi:hypothetical protein
MFEADRMRPGEVLIFRQDLLDRQDFWVKYRWVGNRANLNPSPA